MKIARKNQCLSRKELAKMAEVGGLSVYRIENGYDVSTKVLNKILYQLGLELTLKRKETNNANSTKRNLSNS